MFVGFAIASGLAGWLLFDASREVPRLPHDLQELRVAVIVDEPGIDGRLALNCGADSDEPSWCAAQIVLSDHAPSDARWALVLVGPFTVAGRGDVRDGRDLVTESDPRIGRVPVSRVLGARTRIIRGTVGTGRVLRTSFVPAIDRRWTDRVPVPAPAERIFNLGLRLPSPTVVEKNGLVLGALPALGIDRVSGGRVSLGRFSIDGGPTAWRVPSGLRYVAAAGTRFGPAPPYAPSFLADVRATPPTATESDGALGWDRDQPFTARWSVVQPSATSDAATRVFLAGLLLGVASAALLAAVQTTLRRGVQDSE